MSTDRAFQDAEQERRIANLITFGTIAAVQGNTASVTIEEGWTSDMLRCFQVMSGARARSWSAPTKGEQVCILSPSGEVGAGVILRGISSAAMADPSDLASLLVLFQADDGAVESYDLDAHVRTFTIPASGQLVINVGANTSATVADGTITIKDGDSQVVISNGQILIGGDAVALGGAGGQAVARVGDKVDLHSGLILTGSPKVSAA